MARVLTPRPIAWETIPAEQVYPGVARQVIDGDRQTLVRYVYQPGAVFPVHSHPEEQITIVLTGRIRFTVAGHPLTLGAGEAALIQPNLPHGATVLGNDTVVTLNALSPRRHTHP